MTILFLETPHQLNKMVNELIEASITTGLEMNLKETKIMSDRETTPILSNNTPLQYVNQYIYLGKQISFSKERNIKELHRRVAIT